MTLCMTSQAGIRSHVPVFPSPVTSAAVATLDYGGQIGCTLRETLGHLPGRLGFILRQQFGKKANRWSLT